MEIADSKAIGGPAKGVGTPMEDYTFTYPDNLIDGVRGRNDYGTGEWVGMDQETFDVIVEVDKTDTYTSVTLGTFIEREDDVFGPSRIIISVSENGTDYHQIAEQNFEPAGPVGPERCAADYTVTFKETSAQYFRVKAEPLAAIPSWHKHKGKPAYLFVDEIMVK
jgi:hexosaminidase